MKKYLKELLAIFLQLLLFYVLPLFMGPTDAMGMVLLILWGTTFISLVLGIISDRRIRFLYPAVAAVVFIPSVFIYYNETALVHSLWYLTVSAVGLLIGAGVRFIYRKFN